MTLILIGAGLAHLEVARLWQPVAGRRIVWIAEASRAVYAPLVPRWLAGQRPRDDLYLDLKAVAHRHSIELVTDSVTFLDPHKRLVRTRSGKTFQGDILSICTGLGEQAGGEANSFPAISFKPISQFVPLWERFLYDLHPKKTWHLTHIGAGAAGLEFVLNIGALLRTKEIPHQIDLFEREPTILGLPTPALEQWRQYLEARSIRLQTGCWVKPIDRHHYQLHKEIVTCDWVSHSQLTSLPSWLTVLKNNGLRLQVEKTLQVTGFPLIFAAGDVALTPQNLAPSAAVSRQQGVFLSHNLKRALRQQTLSSFRPSRTPLTLISTGEASAFLKWGSFGLGPSPRYEQLKEFLNQRFMKRF